MENLSISPKFQPSPEITEQSVNDSESVGDCPICCDEMNEPENNIRLKYCCKRTFHAACLRSWANEQKLMNREGTCPMCRGEWPVEFLDQLFRGNEEGELLGVRNCRDDGDMYLVSASTLVGLSVEQKSRLRDVITVIEQEYHQFIGYGGPTQCLLIVFVICPDHPLYFHAEGETVGNRMYNGMTGLLIWLLDHIREGVLDSLSCSKFIFSRRPSGYDHFGPDPELEAFYNDHL